MKKWKQALSLGITGVMLSAAPMSVLAASPEFARTPEEWDRLRDNIMEYEELEGLIAEYNTTVQTNQLDLNKFRQDYGDTRDDISQKYRDMADEIYSNIQYPDPDDPTYGYVVASMLSAEIQAKNMEKQADNNLEDSFIIGLNYEQAEKTLVTVAQTNMVTLEKSQLALKQAELAKSQAETELASIETKASIGMATQVDVLNAKEALLTASRNVESARTQIENVRQKLLVMTGWAYDASPEIRQVPSSDVSRIDGMNPVADREKALEDNYALRVNKKKLENAQSQNTKESLRKTIADQEQKIASALVTNYQNVLAAKLAYDQAAADLELARRDMTNVELQFQQGKISQNQLTNQQYTLQGKEMAMKTADLNLFQTMETYDWSVKGLASAS